MARIKFNDLPKDQKISKEELKRIRGGVLYTSPSVRYFKSREYDSYDLLLIQDLKWGKI
jgi:hypothetical protein